MGLIIVVWSTLTLGFGTIKNPGPAFLPTFCGSVICILSIIVFIQARRKTNLMRGASIFTKDSISIILSAIGILILYAFMLERMGFMGTTFLAMLLIFKRLARESWLVSILESSVVTGTCYLIFGYLLKIPLARGWLGI